MKSDLLKEAIADAKAVKETALANAKMALEEAFTPKLQSMLSHKLAEELDEEEVEMDEELDSSDLGAGDNAEPSDDANDSSDIENDDDLTEGEDEVEVSDEEGEEEAEEMPSEEMPTDDELDMAVDSEEGDDEMSEEDEMPEEEDELDLESVIAELEAALEGDEEVVEEDEMDSEEDMTEEDEVEETYESEDMTEEDEELDINEIIRTLKEMADDEVSEEEEVVEEEEDETAAELEEAYRVITSLKKTINEVNLLNAKLLYTNKLFRTFDLNENQKMKVIENFDRTSSLREVKLVYATLGENLNVARKPKTVVKESLASKPMKSSAPQKSIISEGTIVAILFKMLSVLIK
jgi:hypothetical protein